MHHLDGSPEAAVDAGNNPLTSHQSGVAQNPLRNHFLVLDDVGGAIDDTRDYDHVLW